MCRNKPAIYKFRLLKASGANGLVADIGGTDFCELAEEF
jgi:hypothetical protein